MNKLVFTLCVFAQITCAEYAIETREGTIAYYGSPSVFVGSYTWPTGKEPLGVYSPRTATLVKQYDHPVITCDAATDACTAKGHNLPDGTQVQFGTTGELPAPLVGWQPNQATIYYIRDSTVDTFRVATAAGGTPLDITTPGAGQHGMSFGGYSHVITFAARFARRMTCDPLTDICTTETPHKYVDGTSVYVMNEDGVLPPPLVSFSDSRSARYCAVLVDPLRFQLRFTAFDTPCIKAGFGQNTSTVTCSAATSRCSYSPGVAIALNMKVRFASTQLLPKPLAAEAMYHVTNLNTAARTFQLDSYFNAPGIITLLDAGSGTITMEAAVEDIQSGGAGKQYASYSSGSSIWINNIQGYPQGTTFSFRGNESVRLANSISPKGYGSIVGSGGKGTLIAKVPAVSASGDYPVTITLSESSTTAANLKPLRYTLKAIALEPLQKADPASYPPIPGLAQWETVLTSAKSGGGGATGPVYPRCPNRQNPAAGTGGLSYPSIEAKVWFYDGAANFFEISEYPGISNSVPDQPLWANCGEYIAATLRDAYLKQPSQHAYTYFPRGLYLAYKRTGDVRYKDAIVAIADSGTSHNGVNSEYGMREHAYAFERRLYRYHVTGETDHHLQHYADVAISMLLSNAYEEPSRTFMQPFMAGLLARPLVEYYRIYRDERIPVVLKAFADKFWSNWYNQTTHRMLYNTEPYGPRCTISCAQPVDPILNNLVAPIYAFLWRLTGDETQRERGDAMFSNVFKEATPWDPKQWNQTYYWSWDFVAWRQGTKAAY